MNDSDDLPVGEEIPDDEPGLLLAALREYQAAAAVGTRPDRREFLARYPRVAGELAECLDGLDFVTAAAPALRPAGVVLPPPAADHPEGTLGDFRLVREVGRGGMGVVYEAVQISLGRRVALKVLPFAATLDARQLRRFENEARAAAQLHHSNVVPVYAVGCDRGVHYYAMQLIDGRPLCDVIDDLRRVARPAPAAADTAAGAAAITRRSADSPAFFRHVAELGVQAAGALEYAHQMGVVHRDVKPGNLILDGRGHVWVTDFGLARVGAAPGLTGTGDLVGTLRYMSPEQAAGEPVIDPRGDVYSLGATLYELLTLRPAVPGSDRATCLRQLMEDDPAPPRSLNRAVPVELETVVLKAMARSPADRYPSAAELAADLRRFLDDRPVLARRPSAFDRTLRWGRRHPAWLGAAVVVLLFGVLALAATTALVAREQARTRAAYDRERLRAEEAEQRFRLARRAVDEMVHFGEDDLANAPQLRPMRQRLLEVALAYSQELAELRHDDPAARADLAATRDRVERILADLTALQGAGLIFLLAEPAVLADLGLADDEGEEVAELRHRAGERGKAACRGFHHLSAADREARFVALARANEADIAATLTAGQVRRLKQITLQRQGPAAFREPDVVAALRLTADQRDRIRALEFDAAFGPPARGPRPNPAQAMRRVLAALTDDQRAKWKEMVGDPFTAPRPAAGFPRPR